jgi:hypothetical protein
MLDGDVPSLQGITDKSRVGVEQSVYHRSDDNDESTVANMDIPSEYPSI